MPLRDRAKAIILAVTFAYVVILLCPIRYWPVGVGEGNTWLFALNYAAAHGLVIGRDTVFPMGPLSYLIFPQNIGNNLGRALAFQSAIWMLLVVISWDLFFRGRFPLRNLALFSVLLGLSSPMYLFSPDGPENLLLSGALILLVHFRSRGGTWRYVTALAIMGLLPFIKLTSGMIAAGAVAGVVADRVLRQRWGALREILLAILVPTIVAGISCWLLLRSLHAVTNYVRGSVEVAAGYSLAMSLEGQSLVVFVAAAESLLVLATVVAMLSIRDRRMGAFFSLLLPIPLFVSFKHGFIRQDAHIVLFFCFVSLSLGLVVLTTSLDGRRTVAIVTIALLIFGILWQDYVPPEIGARAAVEMITGVQEVPMLWHVLRFSTLRQTLDAQAQTFPDGARLEPQIRDIVGSKPVASLSADYSNAIVDHLNLVLYPVIERYSAYTPYLDKLEADWIQDKGPRFLIFDGLTIDGRSAWTETPAMWMEIYRWYNTRLLGVHNLLLERREEPRFTHFESEGHSRMQFRDDIQMSAAQQPYFWTMGCALTVKGNIRKELFRVSAVTMTVRTSDGRNSVFRVLPEMFTSPTLGNYLPGNLTEFAEVFAADGSPKFSVDRLTFGGPGVSSYDPDCDFELLRPVQ